MLGIVGKKIGMSQIFDEDARVIPVTVVQAGPCKVVQKKTKDVDGYSAVQVGFDKKSKKNVSKAMQGHFKGDCYKVVREFSVGSDAELDGLEELSVDLFEVDEFVDVVGTSKGRGFTGVMKRHNFSGMKASHGVHESYRGPGSIGLCATPSRVFKGKKLPGQYGNSRVTVKNLRIVKIDKERNLLFIQGAVPGHRNSVVLLKKLG